MRITETHIARLTASGRHVKEIIRNVTGTSLRRISSDTFTDSLAILDNFEALFLEAVVVRQRLKKLAPEVGLEPTTSRLTAARSTIELLWNPKEMNVNKPANVASIGFHVKPRWQGKPDTPPERRIHPAVSHLAHPAAG